MQIYEVYWLPGCSAFSLAKKCNLVAAKMVTRCATIFKDKDSTFVPYAVILHNFIEFRVVTGRRTVS